MAKLQLGSKEGILSAIRKRSREIAATISDKDLFTSDQFFKFAEGLASMMLVPQRDFTLKIQYQPDGNMPIAYTDGKLLCLNAGNEIVAKVDDLGKRFTINLGILFHEIAHKLYLDFPGEKRAKKALHSGELFGGTPDFSDPHLALNLQEIQMALKDPTLNGILINLYHELSNRISDGHDEFTLKQAYPGYVTTCINTAGETQFEQSPLLEEITTDVTIPKFQIYFGMILTYAKLGKFRYETETPAVKEYLDGMDGIIACVDAALITENIKEKYLNLTCILVYLWDSIRDLMKNGSGSNSAGSGSQNCSSGGQSGGSSDDSGDNQHRDASGDTSGSDDSGASQGDPFDGKSPDEAASAIQKAIDGAKGNTAPVPQNCNHSAVRNSQTAPAAGKDPGQSGSDAVAGMMNQLVNEIAKEQATQDIQSAMDSSLRNFLRSVDMPIVCRNVPVHVNRHHECKNPEAYNFILSEVSSLAKNAARAMKELLRELNKDGIQKHRQYGPIIQATESYRRDKRFFAKKRIPSDLPNLAVCVLCDESGSMASDGRVEAARKAMVLLERFAFELNIPCMLAGHRMRCNEVTLEIYSDFTSAMHDADRKCLGDIRPSGCNHDGIPIRLCGELLAKRPEKVKLFIVISDGTPNGAYNYEGKRAIEDIQEAIKKLARKGVTVYGAAIGDDAEIIQEIYGKGFLDLTDLKMLPKNLIRIVRQKIIN